MVIFPFILSSFLSMDAAAFSDREGKNLLKQEKKPIFRGLNSCLIAICAVVQLCDTLT